MHDDSHLCLITTSLFVSSSAFSDSCDWWEKECYTSWQCLQDTHTRWGVWTLKVNLKEQELWVRDGPVSCCSVVSLSFFFWKYSEKCGLNKQESGAQLIYYLSPRSSSTPSHTRFYRGAETQDLRETPTPPLKPPNSARLFRPSSTKPNTKHSLTCAMSSSSCTLKHSCRSRLRASGHSRSCCSTLHL